MTSSKFAKILLASTMVFSSVSPNVLTYIKAEEVTSDKDVFKFSSDVATSVSAGTGYIDASDIVDKFNALEEGSLNLTATCTGSSVNALFFIGDKDTNKNYFTLYINGSKLGIEAINASGTKVVDTSKAITGIDFTKEHKYSMVYKKTDSGYSLKVYVDGEEQLSATPTVGFTKGSFDNADFIGFGKGARSDGGNPYPFTGTLKDIELYNYAISENDVQAYLVKERSDRTFSHVGKGFAGDDHILINEELDDIKNMSDGTINIRFRASEANQGKMYLFSVANADKTKYFDIYADFANNKVGAEATVLTNGSKKDMPIVNGVSINDTNWHTLTIRHGALSTGTGYHLAVDGNQVAGNRYTNGITNLSAVFSDASSIVIGADRNLENDFKGYIESVTMYSGVFTNDEVSTYGSAMKFEGELVPDLTNAHKTEDEAIFYSGYDGSSQYRIPGLFTTKKGTVIAAIDQRNSGAGDAGNIDSVIRRKEKGQTEFDDVIEVLDLREDRISTPPFLIDPIMVQDRDSERIYMVVDMFPQSSGLMNGSIIQAGTGTKTIDGEMVTIVYQDGNEYGYYGEDGVVYTKEGIKTEYKVVTECEAPYKELGNCYKNGEYVGSVFVYEGSEAAPFQILRTQRLWLSYSDDDGKTWSCPKDITGQVKPEWAMFCGVGPGKGLQLVDGTLCIPIYTANKASGLSSQASALITSKDGENWTLNESPQKLKGNDPATMTGGTQLTESQAVQLNNGQVKLFMRSYEGKVQMATSSTGGKTWDKIETISEITDVYCQLSVIHYTAGDKEYVVLSNPSGPGRNNGKVYIGEVDANGNIDFANGASKQMNKQKYCYSCLTLLEYPKTTTDASNSGVRDVVEANPTIGLLYEDDTYSNFNLYYTEFDQNWLYADMVEAKQAAPVVTDMKASIDGDDISVTVTFDQNVIALGDVKLEVGNETSKTCLTYISGSTTNKLVFTGELYEDVKESTLNAYRFITDETCTIEGSDTQAPVMEKTLLADFTAIKAVSASATSESASEGANGKAEMAIDGDSSTYWHSVWENSNYPLPQSLTVDLGQTYNVNRVTYVPRQSSSSARMVDVYLEVSSDNTNWTKVASEKFSGGSETSEIYFDAIDARYVRITCTSSTVAGSCNMAELTVHKTVLGLGTGASDTSLLATIERVKPLIEGDKANAYTDASVKALQDAIDACKDLNPDRVSQNKIDGLEKAIRTAQDNLTTKARIVALIEKVNEFKESDVHASVWAKAQSIMSEVGTNYENATSNAEMYSYIMKVDYALTVLEANEEIVADVNKDALTTLYNNNKDKEAGGYTADSFATFTTALNEAKAILDKDNASQDEVDAAKTKLETAIANLVVKEDSIIDEATLINKNVGDVTVANYSSQCGGEGEPSENGYGQADCTIDQDNASYWHSNWSTHNGEKHTITYDLGKAFTISDVTFLPRQDKRNGDIHKFEVYVGNDTDYTKNRLTGEYVFAEDGTLDPTKWYRANVGENGTYSGRYVTIRITGSYGDSGNNLFASMAEIKFYGVEDTTTPTPVVDKTALNSAISEAEKVNQANYTPNSLVDFTKALSDAKAIAAKENATQDEVNAAKSALDAAKAKLVAKANKSALEATIKTAKALDTTNKTDESKAALVAAISGAEAIIANENATQAQVDAALKTLTDAVANLKDKEVKPETPKPEYKGYDDVNVDSDWFAGMVKEASIRGLMGADGGGTKFNPDGNITRAMVATVLHRMAGTPNVTYEARFSDVSNGEWYTKAIIWASDNKVVSGYANGSFGPDDNITRQDFAIMLRNYAKSKGLNTNAKQSLDAFKDADKVDGYAKSAIQWCVENGLMSGSEQKGGLYLNPTNNATRAEGAKMFVQFDNLLKK